MSTDKGPAYFQDVPRTPKSSGFDGRIYYFAYAHQTPLGGQKHTYRHVDILCEAGYDAAVLHPEAAYRLEWFENDTRVVSEAEFFRDVDPGRDFLVLPEDWAGGAALPGRKVIFNKSLFRTFTATHAEGDCRWGDATAMFTISEHNERNLRLAWPELPIYRVPVEVDPTRFPWRPMQWKSPLVLYSNRKDDATKTLMGILHERARAGLNTGLQYEWICLENFSEEEISRLLQNAVMVISLHAAEGFCRLLLEAMACGCLVAGSAHGPIPEFVPAEALFAHGDFEGLVNYIESVLAQYPGQLTRWEPMLCESRKTVERFSPEAQATAVLKAWRGILATPREPIYISRQA